MHLDLLSIIVGFVIARIWFWVIYEGRTWVRDMRKAIALFGRLIEAPWRTQTI